MFKKFKWQVASLLISLSQLVNELQNILAMSFHYTH